MVSQKLMAALAALSLAIGSEASVCRPQTTAALSSVSTATAASSSASIRISESGSPTVTTESTTETGSTTVEGTTSTTVETTEGNTSTSDAASSTTTESPPATVTSKLAFKRSGIDQRLELKANHNYLMYAPQSTDTFIIPRAGGTVFLGPDGSKKLILLTGDPLRGELHFMTNGEPPNEPYAEVTCNVREDDTVMCQAPSLPGFTSFFQCGSFFYLGTEVHCEDMEGNLRLVQ